MRRSRAGKWCTSSEGAILRQVALLGRAARRRAGADVRAAQRRGDPAGAAAEAVEAPGHDRGEARRARPAVRRRPRTRCDDLGTRRTTTSRSCASSARSLGRGAVRALGPGGARAAAGRGPRAPAAGGRRPRGAARLSGVRPGGWHRSPAGFLAPHPAGGRRKQHPVPRQRADLRRAARGGAVRPAAADRPDPPRPGAAERARRSDAAALVPPLLPAARLTPGQDPFGADRAAARPRSPEPRASSRSYAAPAFVWFSTRLFAGIRTSLNDIYDVSRAARRRGATSVAAPGEAARHGDGDRDRGAVPGQHPADHRTRAACRAAGSRGFPSWPFFVSTLGRLLGELLAFSFSVSLFYLTYRYASARRLPWRTALLASTFTALLFEVAKRLYGLYLANFASFEGPGGDANIGAAVLFILWIYYTAIVFLLGGVVAETWELRQDAAATARRGTRGAERAGGLPCVASLAAVLARRGLYCGCPRSEGRRRVNRVRTSPVAALSDVRCRFGVPGALFGFVASPRRSARLPSTLTHDRPRPPIPSQALRRPAGAGPRRRRAARGRRPRPGGARLSADRTPRGRQDHRRAHPRDGAQLPQSRRRRASPAASARTACGSGTARPTSTWSRSTRPATAAWTTRASCASARCTRASQEGHHKVYIVDEAHMLTREAWNALLKILEEPPPGVVFVFATTEPQKIAATAAPVLSRLQRFDFRRIGPAGIRDRLRQVLDAERHRGRRRRADPHRPPRRRRHAGRALGARPVPELRRGRGHRRAGARGARPGRTTSSTPRCSRSWPSADPRACFPLVDRLVDAGADLAEFMGGAAEVLRALLMLQLGASPRGSPRRLRADARALPDAPRAGRRAADAPAARRERGRDPAEREPPAGGRDAAAALGHAGPDGGSAGGAGGRAAGAAGRRARRPRAAEPRRQRGRPSAARVRRVSASRSAGPARRPPPARPAPRCPAAPLPRPIRAAWPAVVAAVRAREPVPGRGPGRRPARPRWSCRG